MKPGARVGLFVTCLVDLIRPQIGFASVKLLEDAGCKVSVPEVQTCCGQPAWNAGADKDAAAIARQVVDAFVPLMYTAWALMVPGPSAPPVADPSAIPDAVV